MAEYFNGTYEQYRAYPANSQSDLKLFADSKLAYYQQKIAKTHACRDTTPSMQWGIDFERCVREGFNWLDRTKQYPSTVKKKNSEAYNKLVADNPGITFLPPSEFREYEARRSGFIQAYDNLMAHDLARNLMQKGIWHKRILWNCPETGMARKTELDKSGFDEGPWIADLKTTVDPSITGFPKQALNLGYDIQVHSNVEGLTEVKGLTEVIDYYYVAVRNKYPFDVEVHFDKCFEFFEHGRTQSHRLLRLIEREKINASWLIPSTCNVPNILTVPDWRRNERDRVYAFHEELPE